MSVALPLCLAFGLTIRQDQYPLRTGCAEDDGVIARVGRGTTAEIRFGRVDSSGLCYKIAVRIEGKTVEGYVTAAALDGLEQYERARTNAGQGSVQTDRAQHAAGLVRQHQLDVRRQRLALGLDERVTDGQAR